MTHRVAMILLLYDISNQEGILKFDGCILLQFFNKIWQINMTNKLEKQLLLFFLIFQQAFISYHRKLPKL